MTSRIGGLGVAAALSLSLAGFPSVSASQSRANAPTRVTVVPNYGPPPTSLDELWDQAEVVVRGYVEDSHVRRPFPGTGSGPVTDHRLKAIEILKGHSERAGVQTIHVIQVAGSLSIDGREMVVDPGDMPVLAPGQEILVFLHNWKAAGGFQISGGPAGLYILDENEVPIPRRARSLMRATFGDTGRVSKSYFLDVLRKRVSKPKR